MDNTFEVLMNAIKENRGGFSTADFSMLSDEFQPTNCNITMQNEEYVQMVNQVENSTQAPCGEGRDKSAYRINNKILLKSDKVVRPASENFYRALALKKYGINIAMPLFQIHENELKNIDCGDYSYQIQEEAKGSFVSAFRSNSLLEHLAAFNIETFKSSTVQELTAKELLIQYNTQMAKHRAKTGLPHMNKFFSDFRTLKALNHGDVFYENIFFSSKKGYTFFDLEYTDNNINPSGNVVDEINKAISQTSKPMEEYYYRDFFACGLGIYRDGASINFPEKTATQMIFTLVSNKYKPDDVLTAENFPLYVYNGIIAHQAIETMKHATDLGSHNLRKPLVQKFAEKKEKELNKSDICDDGTFAMGSNTLMSLENALLTNNQVALHLIAKKLNLPDDFDFNCIDVPYFLETMKATHEFVFANPNPTPIETPTREHVELKEVNGELEFGLV